MSHINQYRLPYESIAQELPARFYGNEPSYPAITLEAAGSGIDPFVQTLPRVSISEAALQDALEEAAETLEVLEDPKTGKQFEVSFGNLDADNPLFDAEVSTYNSAITSNQPNGMEFAENTATQPNKRRIYIASLGNGQSSYLEPNERVHLRKNGSFLVEEQKRDGTWDVTALPTVKALYRALLANDIEFDRLSANSAGGNLATALMFLAEEGTVTHCYQKGRTNLTHNNALAFGVRMLLMENLISGRKNKAASQDPYQLTDEMAEKAKKAFGPSVEKLQANGNQLGTMQAIGKLLNDGLAFSKGRGHYGLPPAAIDLRYATSRHPEAKTTIHVTGQDRQYKGQLGPLATTVAYAAEVSAQPENVQGLITPGSHADHTNTPSVRWSAESYAFNR